MLIITNNWNDEGIWVMFIIGKIRFTSKEWFNLFQFTILIYSTHTGWKWMKDWNIRPESKMPGRKYYEKLLGLGLGKDFLDMITSTEKSKIDKVGLDQTQELLWAQNIITRVELRMEEIISKP